MSSYLGNGLLTRGAGAGAGPLGWLTREAFPAVPTPTGSGSLETPTTQGQLASLPGTLAAGSVVDCTALAGQTLTDVSGLDLGFGSDAGTSGNPIIYYSPLSNPVKLRRTSSSDEVIRTDEGNDYHEFWGFDILGGTTAVHHGGDHCFNRWCRIEGTGNAPTTRWLKGFPGTTVQTDGVGGGNSDCTIIGNDSQQGEGMYVGWGVDVTLQKWSDISSKRNYYVMAGGGAMDIKANTWNFRSEDDAILGRDYNSGCFNVLPGWETQGGYSGDAGFEIARLRVRCSSSGLTDGDGLRIAGPCTIENSIIGNCVEGGINIINPNSSTIITLTDNVFFGNPQGAIKGSLGTATVNGSGNRWDTAGTIPSGVGSGGLLAGDLVGPTSGNAVATGETDTVGAGLLTGLTLEGLVPS